MEIRYRLPKSIRDVGKHGLKFTEGLSREIGILRIYSLYGHGVRNELRESPVRLPVMQPCLLRIL